MTMAVPTCSVDMNDDLLNQLIEYSSAVDASDEMAHETFEINANDSSQVTQNVTKHNEIPISSSPESVMNKHVENSDLHTPMKYDSPAVKKFLRRKTLTVKLTDIKGQVEETDKKVSRQSNVSLVQNNRTGKHLSANHDDKPTYRTKSGRVAKRKKFHDDMIEYDNSDEESACTPQKVRKVDNLQGKLPSSNRTKSAKKKLSHHSKSVSNQGASTTASANTSVEAANLNTLRMQPLGALTLYQPVVEDWPHPINGIFVAVEEPEEPKDKQSKVRAITYVNIKSLLPKLAPSVIGCVSSSVATSNLPVLAPAITHSNAFTTTTSTTTKPSISETVSHTQLPTSTSTSTPSTLYRPSETSSTTEIELPPITVVAASPTKSKGAQPSVKDHNQPKIRVSPEQQFSKRIAMGKSTKMIESQHGSGDKDSNIDAQVGNFQIDHNTTDEDDFNQCSNDDDDVISLPSFLTKQMIKSLPRINDTDEELIRASEKETKRHKHSNVLNQKPCKTICCIAPKVNPDFVQIEDLYEKIKPVQSDFDTIVSRQMKTCNVVEEKQDLTCTKCELTFTDKLSLEKHLCESPKYSGYKCKYCDEYFQEESIFDLHTQKYHINQGLNRRHLCNICWLRFPSKESLTKHTSKHVKPFACTSCHARFFTKSSVNAHHIAMHSLQDINTNGSKIATHELVVKSLFKCKICQEGFNHQRHLNRHEKVAHGGYQCPKCGKILHSQRTLTHHMQSFHSGKPRSSNGILDKKKKCLTCGKFFRDAYVLRRHISQIHEGVWRSPCPHCPRRYRDAHALHTHMETVHLHPDKRPYQCEHCGKSFKLNKHLQNHLYAKHTQRPQLICEFCAQTFRSEFHLYRHLANTHAHCIEVENSHHGHDNTGDGVNEVTAETSVCDACGECFLSREQRAQHRCVDAGGRQNCDEPEHVICDGESYQDSYGQKHQDTHDDSEQLVDNIIDSVITEQYNDRLTENDNSTELADLIDKNIDSLVEFGKNYPGHGTKFVTMEQNKSENIPKGTEQSMDEHELDKHQGSKHTAASSILHAPRAVVCDLCGQGFSSKMTLFNHMESEHGENMWKTSEQHCRLCGEMCRQRTSLEEHMAKEHAGWEEQDKGEDGEGEGEENDGYCNMCGQVFSDTKQLDEHVLDVHLDEDGFFT